MEARGEGEPLGYALESKYEVEVENVSFLEGGDFLF